jgi:hypothetical protein
MCPSITLALVQFQVQAWGNFPTGMILPPVTLVQFQVLEELSWSMGTKLLIPAAPV